MTASNLFQWSADFTFIRSDIMSHAVYDPVQKKGGYLYHLICNDVETTIYDSPRATGLP